MRACEGCRRRKIKCDAATTNTWPCSACVRLKLHCIPPTVNYDNEFPGSGQGFDGETTTTYESGADQNLYQQQVPLQQHFDGQQKAQSQLYVQPLSYGDSSSVYQPLQHSLQFSQAPTSQQGMQYTHLPAQNTIQHNYTSETVYQLPHYQQQTEQLASSMTHASSSQSPEARSQDEYSNPSDLAELLGDLKMDATGRGMCIKGAPFILC